MPKLSSRSAIYLLAFVVAISSALRVGPAVGQVVRTETMDAAELRPGMRGYGLTVFRGTRPERFDVEIIDVLHGFRPDQDLILVHTEHPILDRALTVGGMSGSPIYIEGRLIGAYAYGWPFGSQPVAGVTPIRNMLETLNRPELSRSFPYSPIAARPSAPVSSRIPRRMIRGEAYRGTAPRHAFSALEDRARRSTLLGDALANSMAPPLVLDGIAAASTPMLIGGWEPSVVRALDERMRPYGIDVLQAGGTGTPSASTPTRFVDGGGLAVTLARGDISSNVIGTVTHVAGERLVGFGHPMVEGGETGLPTAVARVLHVLASIRRSFKIAEPVRALGTMVQDRQPGVVVDQSRDAVLIPVRVRLEGVPAGLKSTWDFEVASNREMTPSMLFGTIASAVKSVASDHSDIMFEARSRVWLSGRALPIELTDRGHSMANVSGRSALGSIRAFDLIDLGFANPFEDAHPTRIEVDLALRFARETSELLGAYVETPVVDPGSRVTLRAVVRPYGRDEEIRHYELQIPESAAGQSIRVMLQPGRDVAVELPEPRTLDDSIEAIRHRYPATSMIISTRLSSRGVETSGHVVRSLPPSALDALQQTTDSERTRPFVTHLRREIELGEVLSGMAHIDLQVRAVARTELGVE